MSEKSIVPAIAAEIFQILEATIEVVLYEFEEVVTSGLNGAISYALLGIFIGVADYTVFNVIGLSGLGINSADKIGELSVIFIISGGILCGIVFGLIRGLKKGARKVIIGTRYAYRFFEYVVLFVVNNANCAPDDKNQIIKILKNHCEIFKSRINSSRILSGIYGKLPFIRKKMELLQFVFIENTINAFNKIPPDILNGLNYDDAEDLSRQMAEKIQGRMDGMVGSSINQIFYKSSIVSYLMVLILFIIPAFLIAII